MLLQSKGHYRRCHSIVARSANVADVTNSGALVRDHDKRIYGDASMPACETS